MFGCHDSIEKGQGWEDMIRLAAMIDFYYCYNILQAIPHDTPGKVGGHPGNAFGIVYQGVEGAVRDKVYDADPVLEAWIQSHLYGDVYSSPGLTMLQKQYLTIMGLVKSHMMEQIYGHAFAALRFGATEDALKEVVDIAAFLMTQSSSSEDTEIFRKAKRTIDMVRIHVMVEYCCYVGTEATPDGVSNYYQS